MPAWPENLKHHYKAVFPMSSHGTTWLCESDLVFVKRKPYAVLSWTHDKRGEHPDRWLELNPTMLKHDPAAGAMYRYEGELQDPAG
jgi:hypothetical protein